MSDINTRRRRQALHRRLARALSRRDQVDGLHDEAVTLELARLRGIEDAAFRLVEACIGQALPVGQPQIRKAVTYLEHALMVEGAFVPTLQPPPVIKFTLDGPIVDFVLARQVADRG